jgi:hypothetical protein
LAHHIEVAEERHEVAEVATLDLRAFFQYN